MKMKNDDLIKNLLVVGSAGAFVISTFLATVIFDKPGANSTAPEPEIQMGMSVAATDQHIEVFMDAVLLLQTLVDIKNISKIDDEGNEEPGGIVDLFPVGAPATGRGTIELRIKTITKDKMPNFANMTQLVTPMAYIKEETLNEFIKSVLKLAALSLANFAYIAWGGVLMGVGCIGGGAAMIFLSKNKTPIEVIDD